MRKVLIAVALLAAACEQKKSKLDDMTSSPSHSGSGSAAAADNAIDIDSKDILNRKEAATSVQVKHVLVGWDTLDKVYQGRLDPRAAKRSNADAAKLAKEIEGKLKAAPDKID